MRRYFVYFLVSGFCGLVYEVVWLRIAMAKFGAVGPLVSVVLSIFMAGLGVGSWLGGRLVTRLATRASYSPLKLYALAELVIASSALVVSPGLELGRAALLHISKDTGWGSLGYHVGAACWIAAVLLPFCLAMGATFPFAMAAIRGDGRGEATRSFSYLYLANVLGATSGTLVSAFVLIEIMGLRGTMRIAALLNAGLAAAAWSQSARTAGAGHAAGAQDPLPETSARTGQRSPAPILAMLFITGLVSMALEIVWVRQFVPYLGTVVYAFATILAMYLLSTFLGSLYYRSRKPAENPTDSFPLGGAGWMLLGLLGLVSLVAADARLPLRGGTPLLLGSGLLVSRIARVALGIFPFCAALGYLTPMLIDRWSEGVPRLAGRAYAINILGCILGPLLACFVLLPWLGEHDANIVLVLPLFVLGVLGFAHPRSPSATSGGWARSRLVAAVTVAASVAVAGLSQDFARSFRGAQVRRDYEATVVAAEAQGSKVLLVNGVGITFLTPITKMMAHLPLAFRATPPENALVICFGMGTTFRSAMSWGVPTTAVDLVPSVPRMFGYYHADADVLLGSAAARVVIDDGRRFLERSRERFDAIVLDPPPPVEAAASGLLYSREFYAAARERLAPDGILQQWYPSGEEAILVSVTRALQESFPYLRAFRSVEGWGYHFLASAQPLGDASAEMLAARLPTPAAADLLEWWPGRAPAWPFAEVLAREVPVESILALYPDVPALTDDRPFNEYYLLRRVMGR